MNDFERPRLGRFLFWTIFRVFWTIFDWLWTFFLGLWTFLKWFWTNSNRFWTIRHFFGKPDQKNSQHSAKSTGPNVIFAMLL
jgi:hypothetical protein